MPTFRNIEKSPPENKNRVSYDELRFILLHGRLLIELVVVWYREAILEEGVDHAHQQVQHPTHPRPKHLFVSLPVLFNHER